MTLSLNGRIAIVTGASSGIGRSIARCFGEEGAHVFLASRSEAPLRETRNHIVANGGIADYEVMDVRDPHAMRRLVAKVVAETGGLHIMVNNAGVAYPDSIIDGRDEHWQLMLETNIIAMLVGSQAAIRAMRANRCAGHIINIGSVASRRAGSGVYGATKAAVHVITENLRLELENDPIRVAEILPGSILTNITRYHNADTVNGMLRQIGEEPRFAHGNVFDQVEIERYQKKLSWIYASADDVARAALYAVTQPICVNVSEIVVRPGKDVAGRQDKGV